MSLGLLVFVATWILGILALFAVAFSGNHFPRLVWSALLLVVSWLTLSYNLIVAKPLEYFEAERLIGLSAFADGAMEFHKRQFIEALGWCFFGALAMNIPPFYKAQSFRAQRLFARGAVSLQLLLVCAVASILYLRGGEGTNGLPVQYTGLAFIGAIAVEKVTEPEPSARHAVLLTPTVTVRVPRVVLVMDESVRGDLLDINSMYGVETGLKRTDLPLVNFLPTSSIANCSESTNVSVRVGVTRARYLEQMKTSPTIWAYAKKAGYRTVYLDGQRHGGRLQNHMDEAERALIDEFFQLPSDTPLDERDGRLGHKLREVLDSAQQPTFVFVNKMGSHFPYEGKYPKSETVYTPTMGQTYFGNEADPQMKVSLGEEVGARLQFKNSYLNSIRWNTAQFFRQLLLTDVLHDTVIAYTADHGQDFHEDGRPGYGTHCSDGAAAPEEGIVPLAFITGHQPTLSKLRDAASMNAGKASQFNLFPTVLTFLGYEESDLSPSNGFESTLFRPLSTKDQKFLSTFYVRWGKQPHWNGIETVSRSE